MLNRFYRWMLRTVPHHPAHHRESTRALTLGSLVVAVPDVEHSRQEGPGGQLRPLLRLDGADVGRHLIPLPHVPGRVGAQVRHLRVQVRLQAAPLVAAGVAQALPLRQRMQAPAARQQASAQPRMPVSQTAPIWTLTMFQLPTNGIGSQVHGLQVQAQRHVAPRVPAGAARAFPDLALRGYTWRRCGCTRVCPHQQQVHTTVLTLCVV